MSFEWDQVKNPFHVPNSLTLKFVASKEGVTQDIALIVFVAFFGMCVHPVLRTAPVNYANIVPLPLNVSFWFVILKITALIMMITRL